MANFLTASAKVNLLLRVLGADGAGYHNLRSLVTFSDFGDGIWIEESSIGSDEIIWQSGSDIIGSSVSDNILLRVLARVRDFIDLSFLRIHLLKRIPIGGGLGGGSSDAGILLTYLVGHYGLSREDSLLIASELGSDIVVCLEGRSCWLGGRGDDIIVLANFPEVYCLLACGSVSLSTSAVFGTFGVNYSGDLLNMPCSFGSYGDLLNYLFSFGGNDLWSSAVSLCGGLVDLRDLLVGYEGSDYVAMSGSGSSMFGLFWDRGLCDRACSDLLERGYFAVVTDLR